MTQGSRPWPVSLTVRRRLSQLEISFDDGRSFCLSASRLRAMTPSVADRGHGGLRDEPVRGDFSHVKLLDAQAVGAYAVRLVFDDGHDSGIYTWEWLHHLGTDDVLPADALGRPGLE